MDGMLELSNTPRRIGFSPRRGFRIIPLRGSGIHRIVGYDRSLLTSVFKGQTFRDDRASLVQPGHRPAELYRQRSISSRSLVMRMVFPSDPGCLKPAYRQKLPRASAGDGLAKRPPETGTKKTVALARNSERGNSDSPGLLLLDSFLEPTYVNVSQMHINLHCEDILEIRHVQNRSS